MDKEKVLTINQVEKYWDDMVQIYPSFDSAPQSFYFAIVSMLQMQNAKNVLQIGCGRCVLLPYCLQLLGPNASYFATDLSPKMIQSAKVKLTSYIQRFGSTLTLEEWCAKNRLTVKVANGEELIEPNVKFDKIICNMVLMLTQNPEKMLKSLYDQAQEGCLLGISVWGNKQHNLFMEEMSRVVKQLKVQVPKSRSNFHLYNKVPSLGQQVGWKLVVTWQQVSTFPYLTYKDTEGWAKSSTKSMTYLTEEQRTWVFEQFMKRQKQRVDQNKQALTFPAQICILRK